MASRYPSIRFLSPRVLLCLFGLQSFGWLVNLPSCRRFGIQGLSRHNMNFCMLNIGLIVGLRALNLLGRSRLHLYANTEHFEGPKDQVDFTTSADLFETFEDLVYNFLPMWAL